MSMARSELPQDITNDGLPRNEADLIDGYCLNTQE